MPLCPRPAAGKGAQHEEGEKGEGQGRRGRTRPGSALPLAPGCSLTLKSLPWNEQSSFLLEVPLRAVVFEAETEWWPQSVGRTRECVSLR